MIGILYAYFGGAVVMGGVFLGVYFWQTRDDDGRPYWRPPPVEPPLPPLPSPTPRTRLHPHERPLADMLRDSVASELYDLQELERLLATDGRES